MYGACMVAYMMFCCQKLSVSLCPLAEVVFAGIWPFPVMIATRSIEPLFDLRYGELGHQNVYCLWLLLAAGLRLYLIYWNQPMCILFQSGWDVHAWCMQGHVPSKQLWTAVLPLHHVWTYMDSCGERMRGWLGGGGVWLLYLCDARQEQVFRVNEKLGFIATVGPRHQFPLHTLITNLIVEKGRREQ